MKHLNIQIQGKVQGVFFRASARDMARKLNINGYAENKKDGSVYIEAEGEDEDLEKFVEWCHRGPQSAMVAAVDFQVEKLVGFVDFTIRR